MSYESLLRMAPDFNPPASKLFINALSGGTVEASTAYAFDVYPIPYASRIEGSIPYFELKTP